MASTSPKPAITAQTWAAGNASLQVPLAGLLAADPSLRQATLTVAQWQRRLNAYQRSVRV